MTPYNHEGKPDQHTKPKDDEVYVRARIIEAHERGRGSRVLMAAGALYAEHGENARFHGKFSGASPEVLEILKRAGL